MADSRKFCGTCFLPAPPDWNQRYCSSCGGRLKLKLVKKKNVSQGRSRAPGEDRPKKERKPRSAKLSRKSLKPDSYSIFAAREKSVLGPRFHVLSPGALFILNMLSMGLRSTFWVMNRTRPLFMMACPEEKNIKLTLSLWITSFCAYFSLLALIVFNISVRDAGIADYLAESLTARAMAVMFAISFIINRHILYWAREVIIDELMTNELDFIRSRSLSFAPSPMLIWFAGVPYIQHHINRMIKRKGLNTYKSLRRVSTEKTRGGEEHDIENNKSPDPATEA